MKIKLSFPNSIEVEVGKSVDVKVQVSEMGSEPSYPDGTFWRHKYAEIDERVFYVENQKKRHVKGKAWKPMSEALNVTWADVKPLSEEDWRIFLNAVEEGEPIEEWPEAKENHHTNKVYRTAHTSPSKTNVLHDLWELGFNVMHTNDSMKFDVADFQNWLNKCREKDMYFLPRIIASQVESILPHIKDDPNLAGVAYCDELDSEKISKDDQKRFATLCKQHAPNVLRFGLINQGDWAKWVDFDSWDIIMATTSPFMKGWIDEKAMETQINKIKEYVPSNKPFIPIIQGYMDEKHDRPDLKWQFDWWNGHIPGGVNSYGIYLHGMGNDATGFAEDNDMKEQVKQLNQEVK